MVALAAATQAPSPASRVPSRGSSVSVSAVGPKAAAPAQPAAMTAPAKPGGASQLVSGTVSSTSGVALSGGRPSYRGTEPALMTVAHRGSQTTVTVTGRYTGRPKVRSYAAK